MDGHLHQLVAIAIAHHLHAYDATGTPRAGEAGKLFDGDSALYELGGGDGKSADGGIGWVIVHAIHLGHGQAVFLCAFDGCGFEEHFHLTLVAEDHGTGQLGMLFGLCHAIDADDIVDALQVGSSYVDD